MAPVSISPIKVGHIDDVQELRKARPTTVPPRYVRDISERPTTTTTTSSMHIPTIDLSKFSGENINSYQFNRELSKLAASCKEWGFFQVINHGIEREILESIEKVATEFFMLPLEEKQKFPMAPGTVQGYGHAFVFSEDQKLDWCNMLALAVEPFFMRNHKLWPTKPTKFSEILEIYSVNIRRLCQKLLRFIAMSLGSNKDVFNEKFGNAVQAVRMNYYPPCSRPDLVLGLSPHSDGSGLTVLQQAMGSSVGLQVLKDDKWVPIQPNRNALVINIGDTLEVLTNGKYKSVEHRAVTHKEKDRLSIVTFYAPSYEVEVGPLPEFIGGNRPCMYKKYNHGDYSRHYITNKLQGKKTLDFAKLSTQVDSKCI
ncbi:hypothetical protein GIB67_042180 [Kingdonia uniflora]|uniref:Fe2OG dioxygenase domain-containing protein n=1 Tax=Kingdonia uniflora TaxID=39325 RepID=A0A7J7NWU3_9MAGN|nr:hypothetical protein GIB67_042180 [Kingdonia uniflora]